MSNVYIKWTVDNFLVFLSETTNTHLTSIAIANHFHPNSTNIPRAKIWLLYFSLRCKFWLNSELYWQYRHKKITTGRHIFLSFSWWDQSLLNWSSIQMKNNNKKEWDEQMRSSIFDKHFNLYWKQKQRIQIHSVFLTLMWLLYIRTVDVCEVMMFMLYRKWFDFISLSFYWSSFYVRCITMFRCIKKCL